MGYTGWKIDGIELPTPNADVVCSESDLDAEGSGRDELGYMHRIVLRHRVKKWSFVYGTINEQRYETIKNIFDGKADFLLEFFENGEKKSETRAYSSGIQYSLHNIVKKIYKGVSFDLIEV